MPTGPDSSRGGHLLLTKEGRNKGLACPADSNPQDGVEEALKGLGISRHLLSACPLTGKVPLSRAQGCVQTCLCPLGHNHCLPPRFPPSQKSSSPATAQS